MQKKQIVIITNAPAPYRVAFFQYIQQKESEYQFHIMYASKNDEIGRQWHVNEEALGSHTFLRCRVLTIHKKYDDKHIVFSTGVARELKKRKPDLVICMEYNATVLQAVGWCRIHRIPYLSWSDGTANSERTIGKLQKLFRRYVIGHAAGFLASSSATVEHQISYGAERSQCYKTLLTVDIEKYRMKKPEDYKPGKTLLYVGSLIGRKGLDLLLPALSKTSPEIKLVLVGEGCDKQALKKQSEELGLGQRVTFLGFLEGEALKKCYAQSDVFILPTREDCYGLVLLEAMCASLAVIASKYADGAFDLMENGVHGAIVDPYDTKALADAIEDMFRQPERLRQIQRNCYERAGEFSIPKVAEEFYRALDECSKIKGNL